MKESFASNDEIMFYDEAITLLFKNYGVFTNHFSMVRKTVKAKHVWYVTKSINYKLVNGVGTLSTYLLIESSGYTHHYRSNGDTLNQLKNASDSLKHLSFQFMDTTILKKAKVYSIHVNQETLTLISYSIQLLTK